MNYSINIKQIFGVIKSYWIRIVVIILFITCTGGAIGLTIPKVYEAEMDILVNYSTTPNTGVSINEIDANLRLIETYKYLLTTNQVLEKVSDSMDNKVSINELKNKITIISNNQSQIMTIQVQDGTAKGAVDLVNMVANVFQEEIKTLMKMENLIILGEASIKNNTKVVNPHSAFYFVISFFLGTFICFVFLIIKETYFTILNLEELTEKHLSLPSMGSIPVIKDQLNRFENSIESFRNIRANIQFQLNEQTIKSVVITSSVAGEGKSFISASLAKTFAMDNKKVVYVDADLRRPVGRKIFNMKKQAGITSFVAGQAKLADIIQLTEFENLSFIGAGPYPPNPAEISSSNEMKILLNQLEKQFDVIIIDSPPLLVADVLSLVDIADGCLLVINGSKTKKDIAKKSLEKLHKVQANVLGTILNRNKFQQDRSTDYY
ncbi:polysaccharide biosynthesis tyrosine autokinase [Psychrobacillus sp. INOP01]|uniref:polysaccharide biosynthesis tyrosine autokinase n=1 Tax=Psychrobacillus sp. INOP01 TaxID=2829187 RepID=UPI001BA7BFCF|nr:polysaccharide biosynthesis tyrosine autokinase [Psychrobacillus sp. INOP01]QUG42565.1 polysaccharide biosynthesis tyrosine autokinase [Psychrobacillus sp. INOP01]